MTPSSPLTHMPELIRDTLTSSDHLTKKHVHPKLSKLLDMGGFSTVFTHAEGPYLWDLSGSRYLDFLAGGGVFFVGRNHPVVHQYVGAVLERNTASLTATGTSNLGALLSQRLNTLAGGHYPHTMFANSGTEATDVAVRTARQVTGRSRFLFLEGSFHGRSCAAIALCGFDDLKDGQDPTALFATPLRPNDIAQLRRELAHGDVAGFIFEPLQGLTSIPLDHGYLQEASRLCSQHGTVLIADEVQTGLGRCGAWFRSRDAGIVPDILTLSKTLSGGAIPVSAVMLGEEIWQRSMALNLPHPSFDEPFAENDLAMAAGLATLDVLEDLDAPTKAARLGKVLRASLEEMATRHDVIDHVVGEGLMMSVHFKDSAKLSLWAQQRLIALGDKTAFGAAVNVDLFKTEKILVQIPGPGINGVKFLPPVVSTDQDIQDFLTGLDASLTRCYGRQGPVVTLGKGLFNSVFKQVSAAVPEQWMPPAMKARMAPPPQAAPRLDTAGVYEFDDYAGPIVERCDFVVVGSGPGGALVAKELAEAGKRVIVVEAGPVTRTEEYIEDTGKSLARLYYEGGTRTTLGGNVIMPTMQARCMGGGSVINAAICLRAADWALHKWADESGLPELLPDHLAEHYDAVESFMGVQPTPANVQGRRNDLFREGCDALGWSSEPISRNVGGCEGSGRCLIGCPNGAKKSTDLRGIPEVVAAGGRVFTSVSVDKVLLRDGKAVGIEGHVSHPDSRAKSHAVTIHAKCVVMASGAIHTPFILRSSGLKRPEIGGNLRFHPSGFHMGIFDEPVEPWVGATQGYHTLQFIEEGIKLESLWASPSMLALRFPGYGKTLKRYLSQYDHVATWATWVSGDSSTGTVRSLAGRPRISYTLADGDIRRLQEANAKLAEMLFAAGAKGVITGLEGVPTVLEDPADVALIRKATFQASDFPTGSNHVFGTAAMGGDPAHAVTDAWGKVYDVEDLYVADGSLLPSSPGVNPMLTIMALARRIGQELPKRY